MIFGKLIMCWWVNILVVCCMLGDSKKVQVNIGGIFNTSQNEQEQAFRLQTNYLNTKHTNVPFILRPIVARYEGRNTLVLSRKVCQLLEHGVIALVGPNSPIMSEQVRSICEKKDLLQIETHWSYGDERYTYTSVNLHPHPSMVQKIFVDLISWLNWNKFEIIYQDNLSLSKIHRLLNYKSNEFDIKLRQLELDSGKSYRNALNTIKASGETHFVVVCDLETLEMFLHQSQQVGLLSEKHHYIIYNFDMDNIDVEPYQYGGCEIFTVRFFDASSADIRNAASLLGTKQRSLKLETALIMDAVKLVHKSLKSPTINIYSPIPPSYCNKTETWYEGDSYLNDFKMRSIRGYTGLVKFDNSGRRNEFEAEIVELTADGLTKIGTWNTSTGLSIKRPSVVVKKKDGEASLNDKHFTVITVLTPPYGLIKGTTIQLYGNDRYEGFGIDMIHELSKLLGFNYTIVVQEDGANGSFDKRTGKWDGMIGKILSHDADLAIGDFTITSEREKAVDFTLPFMTLGISILYKKPEPVPPSLFMFASPFSPKVWLLLCIAYVFVSISLFVMGRLSPSEWQNPYPCIEEPEYLINQFSFRNSFWFTVGSLMQQGTELAPIGVSTRMLAGVWWFFTLIMVSSYTANLAAFLTVTTLKTPFNNIEELARQNEIQYGAKANGATATFFRDSDKDVYATIWKHMAKNPDAMVAENNIGIDRVENENYAFLMESTTIEYVTERHCNLAQVGGQLDEKGYGVAMRKGETYRAILNPAILKLQETGWLTALKIKWWKEKLGGGTCQQRSSTVNVTRLDLKNVGGVFLVLGVGTFLGLLMTFLELSLEILSNIKRDKIKYRKQMSDEIKFFLNFKKNVKPVKRFETTENEVNSFDTKNYLENYINENSQNG